MFRQVPAGSAVETQRCGGPISGTWECIYGAGSGNIPADRPEVIAEIGPGCRCGCIVHLGMAKPRRLIASSSKSCPGRTFWLIQADDENRVRLKFDFFHLPCSSQWLKIRDGDSLSSELIGHFIGGNGGEQQLHSIISSNSLILVEFFSDELETTGQSCGGGFLAHAQQIIGSSNLTIMNPNSKAVIQSLQIAPPTMQLTIAHIFFILFISIIIVISLLLGAQYLFRYRKYQLAENIGEPDSPAHTPRASLTSFNNNNNNRRRGGGGDNSLNGIDNPPSRAISTTTLLSEVISLVKLRPMGQRVKHSRLRESVDIDTLEKGSSNKINNEQDDCDEDIDEDDDEEDTNDDDLRDRKSQSDEDDISINSAHTLTNEILNDLDNPNPKRKTFTKNHKKVKTIKKSKKKIPSPTTTVRSYNKNEQKIKTKKTHREFSKSNDIDNYSEDDLDPDDDDDVSDIERDSGDSYSPPSISNRSISLPPTPSDTPIPLRKLTKKGKYKENRLETKSVNGRSRKGGRIRDVSPVREEDVCESNVDDVRLGDKRLRMLSASNVTLTNVRGCYSPASSMTSTATIRTTNQKESKEKQNREKLLAGPGSEFSLANPEDLELDYYDYNVINAGAAPGSYLGMDPAYLVWIPPIDDGNIMNEIEMNEPHYEEILPRHPYIDPGSNTETPDDEIIPELPPFKQINNKILTEAIHNSPIKKLEYSNNKKNLEKVNAKLATSEIIQLHEFPRKKFSESSQSIQSNGSGSSCSNSNKLNSQQMNSNSLEKETSVIKSNNKGYYELDDIQFADDDDDDEDDIDDDNYIQSKMMKMDNYFISTTSSSQSATIKLNNKIKENNINNLKT